MSIYLAHNHKMLKADSQRPGRYFGWISSDIPGLIYLTYFTNNFVGSSSTYDSPVARDNSIPLIQGQTSDYNPDATHGTIGSNHPGLPDDFKGYDCQNVKFNYNRDHEEDPAIRHVPCDTFDLPWNLPFTGSDPFTITFRAYYPTDQYIVVWYDYASDKDYYWLNPSVSVIGNNNFGTGDFDSERYPHKVMMPYGGSSESNPKTWPTDFPNVRIFNGTEYAMLKDRTYDDTTPYPPAGRKFYQFENADINQLNGDQWYYTAIVGHGDGTVSLYVNGDIVMNVPFETLTKLQLYTGAKKYTAWIADGGLHNLQDLKVTELSVWNRDLSYNARMNVTNQTSPIYLKKNGQYIPNGLYKPVPYNDPGIDYKNVFYNYPSKGTISSDKAFAKPGTTVTLSCTPDSGYALSYYTLDGVQIVGSSFTMPSSNVTVGAVIEVDPPAGVVKIGNTYWKTTFETINPTSYETNDVRTFDGIKYYNRYATGALQNRYVGTHYRLPTYAELQDLYSNIGATATDRFNNVASTTGWSLGNGNNTLGLDVTPVGYVSYSDSTTYARYGDGYLAYLPYIQSSISPYAGQRVYVRGDTAFTVINDTFPYPKKDAALDLGSQFQPNPNWLLPIRLVWDPDHLTEAPI